MVLSKEQLDTKLIKSELKDNWAPHHLAERHLEKRHCVYIYIYICVCVCVCVYCCYAECHNANCFHAVCFIMLSVSIPSFIKMNAFMLIVAMLSVKSAFQLYLF